MIEDGFDRSWTDVVGRCERDWPDRSIKSSGIIGRDRLVLPTSLLELFMLLLLLLLIAGILTLSSGR
jgi:hypothetical protein